MNHIESDIEILLGRALRGDLTAQFYELIKDTEYKEELLELSAYVSDRELIKEIKEALAYDAVEEPDTDTSQNSGRGLSLEGWLSLTGESE